MAKFKALNRLFGRILKKKNQDSSFSSGGGPRGWWRRRYAPHNNESTSLGRSIGLIRVMSSFLKRKPRKCKENNEDELSESDSISIHSTENVEQPVDNPPEGEFIATDDSITSIESGNLRVQPNIEEEVYQQRIQTKKRVTFQLQQLESKEMEDDTISEASSLTTVTELNDYPWDDDISSELTSLTDDGCDTIATDNVSEFDACDCESCNDLSIVKESVTKALCSGECESPSTETADFIWKWITVISITFILLLLM